MLVIKAYSANFHSLQMYDLGKPNKEDFSIADSGYRLLSPEVA